MPELAVVFTFCAGLAMLALGTATKSLYFTAVGLLLAVAVSIYTWWGASEEDVRLTYERPAPVHTVAESLGLVSGQAYPMDIGSRTEHQTLESSSRSFVFWNSSSTSTETSSTQRLGFTDDEGVSYIFEISDEVPVTYHQSTNGSSVAINLTDKATGSGGILGPTWSVYGMIEREPGCDTCDWEYTLPDDLAPNALEELVERYVESVEITLTPEEFQSLLRP